MIKNKLSGIDGRRANSAAVATGPAAALVGLRNGKMPVKRRCTGGHATGRVAAPIGG